MRGDQARRLKELEQENARQKKPVADLSLDYAILKRGSRGIVQVAEKKVVGDRGLEPLTSTV